MPGKSVVLVALLAASFFQNAAAQDEAGEEPRKKTKSSAVRPRGGPVSFKSDVVPLMKKHCLPCHAEEQMNPSELFMDSYESLMAGGKHGKPVEPGKAKESLLIQKLSDKPPFGDRMPLKAKDPLPNEEMKIFVDWINQGAKKN